MAKAAPLAMVAAGAVLGGLIALSSASGPSPLKTEGLTSGTTTPGSTVNFSNNSLAPIVDEPTSVLGSNVAGSVVTPNSVIAAAVLPGSTTSSSAATTVPGTPPTSATAGHASTAGPAPADNRNPTGAVFTLS